MCPPPGDPTLFSVHGPTPPLSTQILRCSLLQYRVEPEWHSVKRKIFYMNYLWRVIPHVFLEKPLRLAGQSSLDVPGVRFAPPDEQYSGQVGLASPKKFAG